MEKEFKHRFYNEVEESVRKGINQFILYGKNLYEDLFFNESLGVATAVESLVFNLLHISKMKKVVVFQEDGVFLYSQPQEGIRPSKKSVTKLKEELLRHKSRTKGLRDKHPNATQQTSNNAQRDSQQEASISQTQKLNMLRDITEILEKSKEPIGVIVNSLEWSAELFEGKDHKIDYLKEIEKWKNIDMSDCIHLTFVLLNSIDIIKRYFFIDESSNGVIYVGAPTVDEIKNTYDGIITIKIEDIQSESIKKTASLIKNNKYLLKNAIYLFATILKNKGDAEFYDDKKFYNHFVEQLKANVDDDVVWDDVILNKNIKDKILTKFTQFLNDTGEIKKGSKGFIFYGPPGTGKTHIAKALANRGGFYFMAPKLADIKGRFVGESGKNVQKIFNEARANAPTLLFLDELDTVFSQRGSGNTDSFQQDIINQFLAEIDGVDSAKQDIFLIGATNRIETIDSAMISRLESIEIALPNTQNRKEIFQHHLKEIASDLQEADYEELAKRSDGLSGRDIKGVSENIVNNYKNTKNLQISAAQALQEFKTEVARMMKNAYFDITLYDETKNNQGFNAIIGYQQEKGQLSSMVYTILNADDYKKYDSAIANYNGILMYGPPGNGKTHIAYSLANEFKLDFVKVIGSSLASSMQDGAVKILDEIVQNVVKLSALHPIMLFFDEFDAIVSPHMDSKLRGTMLDRITYMRNRGNILLVAATNKDPQELNEAVIRDGRFDEKIFFDHPKEIETITQLFISFCTKGDFDTSTLDFSTLSQQIAIGNTSISSIEKMCNDAKRRAVQSKELSNAKAVLKMEFFN